jgi:hypothetical protein
VLTHSCSHAALLVTQSVQKNKNTSGLHEEQQRYALYTMFL